MRLFKDMCAGGRGFVVAAHPGSVPVDCYETLAGALPTDIGLGVLELETMPDYRAAAAGESDSTLSLSHVAGYFAKELTEGLRDRPYVLVGWSFGGVVAYAVSEVVPEEYLPERLLLLDSIAPGTGERNNLLGAALPDREALDWFAMYFSARRKSNFGFAPDDFDGTSIDEGLERILVEALRCGAVSPDTSVHGLRKVFKAYIVGILRNKWLQDGYAPGPPRLPVTLVRPVRGLLDKAPALGWDRLLNRPIEVTSCSGNHYTMLDDPNSVEQISSLLEETLDRAARER